MPLLLDVSADCVSCTRLVAPGRGENDYHRAQSVLHYFNWVQEVDIVGHDSLADLTCIVAIRLFDVPQEVDSVELERDASD